MFSKKERKKIEDGIEIIHISGDITPAEAKKIIMANLDRLNDPRYQVNLEELFSYDSPLSKQKEPPKKISSQRINHGKVTVRQKQRT